MQDHDSEHEGEVPNPTAPTLRINLPTAASVAGGDETVDERGAEIAPPRQEPRRFARPVSPYGGSDDLEASRRIVGRSLSERVADSANTPNEIGEGEEPRTGAFVLPDWADPPTGLVPRVLLDDEEARGYSDDLVETGRRGPSWREEGSDWDDDASLSFLGEEDLEGEAPHIAGQPETSRRSYDLGFDEVDFDFGPLELNPEAKWDEAFADREDSSVPVVGPNVGPRVDHDQKDDLFASSMRRGRHRAHVVKSNIKSERNAILATIVGVALGALALVCFHFGPRTTLLLVAFAVTVAAAELFSSLQQAGYRPATLIGIVAVPVMIIGTYLHGPIAIPFVFALLMLSFAIWGIAGLSQKQPILNLGVTALVVSWTGVLGSFAGLLLNSNSFPNRHGVAYIVGAVALTVAHDVGSYAVGARLGRHKLAPRVSPGKTREGLIGGSVLTLVVAVALVAHIHPYTLLSAILLAIAVLIFAPIGDLFESVAKRDLGLQDMGRILPAHGGIFDRIDAMLFVLPACYLLLRMLGKN